MKVRGRHVVLSLVCLVLGFITAYSYNLTKKQYGHAGQSEQVWNRDYQLRQQMIQQEERNRELQEELLNKQEQVASIEKELTGNAKVFFNLAEDAEKYRLYLGKVKVKGKGLKVTLQDGSVSDKSANPNDYLVHEQHVLSVVNELYISGAEAVAINGQRLSHSSYIVCDGPVITVDGTPYPAPFVISAIGEPETLEAAFDITGGLKERLIQENISVKLEKVDSIVLDPVLGS
ncbi:DUF881 domain-containing protein [Peribacillus sp. SCS-155]|uniref:DUF881 domain-containing protein n=1 Tax=Peribacillus sedimenti TaxID=3115297 RepID=UPI00390676C7